MKLQLVKDAASTILTVFVMDDTATDGSGLAGLIHTSSITGGYVRMGGTGVALTVDEDVATEGTYAAPSTAAQVRIGTPANMEDGIYELHFHDDLFATGAESVTITLSGATDMAPLVLEVQLMDPIADLVWDPAASGHVAGGTMGALIGTLTSLAADTRDANVLDQFKRTLAVIESQRGAHTHQPIGDIFFVDPINGGTHGAGNRGGITDPYDSLQDCHDNAVTEANHDLIILLAGDATSPTTLTETLAFTKSYMFVRGPGRDFIITRSGAGDTIDIQADGVELSGFQLNTAGSGNGNGIQLTDSDFMRVEDVWINNTRGDGINILRGENCIIKHCTFTDTGQSGAGDGIDILGTGGSSGHNHIEENHFHDCGGTSGDSIQISAGTIDGTMIVRNTIEGSTDYGINIGSGSTNALVADNRMGNNGSGNINDDGATSVLINNISREEMTFNRLLSGTSTGSSTTLLVQVQAGDPPSGGGDNDYNDQIMLVWDGSDKSTARVAVRNIDDYDDGTTTFTISPALEFTPGAGDLVEIYASMSAAIANLSALTGGFGTTTPDRLVDHLRAMMSKAATAPASTGTYDPATDSLEHIGESLDLMAGASFDTSTDSLQAIRDVIDALLAPAVVSASSLSGSGFLSDVVSLVRKATDEPNNSPKYTDGDIVELVQVAMDTVITDIHAQTDHPITMRYNITLVDGQQDYPLPVNVGELLQIAKINSTTGLPEYEVWPGSYMNPSGQGWKLEGGMLRLLRDWDSTDTLQLLYVPNAEPLMHKGTAEAITDSGLTLMATPTDGTLGMRPNEYVGMLVRALSHDTNVQEERLITAYNEVTRIATMNLDWTTTPTGTLVYEVIPIYSRLIKHVIALRAAIDLLAQEGNSARMATLNQNYMIKISAMRRAAAKKEGRFPHHFDGDTWDNTNRQGFYGL